MGATLREVARRAGVSVATASRALNRPELVEEGTRRRVLALADELAYTPNQAARALSTGRSGTLGLVVPDLNNPFYPGIVKGAQARAQETGRAVLIADTDEDPAVEAALVETLARRTDAVVLCSSRMTAEELDRARRLCPVVLINRRDPNVASVSFDTTQGVREVAAHLRALGHRRVAYVGGPAHSFSEADRDACIRAELPGHGLEVVHLGHHEPSPEGGRAAADRVLLAGVTAVLAYNDVIALGLIGRLQAYGLRVPADLSVVGWDDIEYAAMLTPQLTTVRIPRDEAGRAAVEYLDASLAGRPASVPELGTHLVFRQTTGRAPAVPVER